MLINNRKARYEYALIEEYDAGLVLLGTEVKSIRLGNANISDSFVYIKGNDVWVKNFYISQYKESHALVKHEENREKKLLLNKKEINKIRRKMEDKGTAVIALGIFIKHNRLKMKIAVAKGKKNWDKKESIKLQDIKRELKRELKINIL